MKSKLIMGLIVVLVVGGAIGAAAWLKSISPELIRPNSDIIGEKVFVRDYSHMTSSKDAKVQLVEFGDYQCPACRAANTIVVSVLEKYKTNPDFNFVFRNFPLPQHSSAQISAQAAEAAGAQGKYWEMEKLIYDHQDEWAGSINAKGKLIELAQSLNLDLNRFSDDISTSKYINEITQDYMDGTALGVNGTPTFFLNGDKIDYPQLDAKISELLGK